ncbi:undecaprenyl-diphosphatase UppP [Buchananella hordeovulneris]|uniref:Undecaprenyl-diphosphatase n=1 Tax=Buchananella hordeovulneris TaxID=52770 RepID=A0A1Q5PXH2_9ACTO|nr:undecaprenyl-diphosphatase UppP [Buchananella hordeovulneris]MDO5080783.1 undecaprenyl-diphosphatase UppP [Buchananella hordeovulneris]OKL52308.1 undecaprenyl-diphosphatase UppP [Buchananella hordeovulneris]
MNIVDAIILGLLQALTEFLPISSSAHLRVVGELLGQDPGAAFTAITQIGTELAVLVYFRRDIVRIIGAWWRALPGLWHAASGQKSRHSGAALADPDARLGWMIIVGSLPIVGLGVLFEEAIDSALRNLWITATMLIVFGLILGWADRRGANTKTLRHMRWGEAVLYGLSQAAALVPGVSRSGGTITAGRLMGFQRAEAARYSFLLAMPAVFGAGLYKLFKGDSSGVSVGAVPTLVATIIAFVVGYIVIVGFLKFVQTRTFVPFVLYRIVFGFVVIGLLLGGIVPALPSFVS